MIGVLLTLNSAGQDAYLDHSYVNAPGFSVGDTLVIKFNPFGYGEGITPTQISGYFEYNNKLLQKIGEEYIGEGNISTNHWGGYKYNPSPNHPVNALSAQRGNGKYEENPDFNVMALFVQSSETIPADEFLKVSFIIKDRGLTTYSDYSQVTMLNFATFRDNRTGVEYSVDAFGQSVDLGDVSGVNAGDIVINLNTPAAIEHASDYEYTISLNDEVVLVGEFDSNGQAIISSLTNGIEYECYVFVGEDPRTLVLDDVITITDSYLTFQEAIARDGGSGGSPDEVTSYFTQPIQYLLGELNNSGNVDFEDSYISLAHVNGVDTESTYYTSTSNGALDLSGEVSEYGTSSNEYYFGQKTTFTPTDSLKVFEFSHGLVGDVDFSHSYEPTTVGPGASVGKSSNQSKVETQTIDIVSELIEGKVVVSISANVSDMVGSQFNITYDTSILTLDEVVFDTGNTMSNFTNHKEPIGKVWLGSLDQSGNTTIKNGTPYKLIFTPNQTIQNTIGLVSFDLTEGVKADGTKIKFEF